MPIRTIRRIGLRHSDSDGGGKINNQLKAAAEAAKTIAAADAMAAVATVTRATVLTPVAV